MALSTAEAAAASLPPIEETEEVFLNSDDMETLPGHGKETQKKDPLEEDEEPAVEPEPDPDIPPDEEEDPDEPAELTDEQKKAAAFDNLTASMTRNPVGLIAELMQGLSPEQRAALGIQPAPPEPALNLTGDGWAEANLTEPEKFVKKNAHIISDLLPWSQRMQGAVIAHERVMVEQSATIAALMAQVEALADAQGMKLPALKVSLDPKEQAAYKKEVKAEAQKLKLVRTAAATVTPKTPKNGSGGGAESADLTPRAGETFVQTFRRVAAAARNAS